MVNKDESTKSISPCKPYIILHGKRTSPVFRAGLRSGARTQADENQGPDTVERGLNVGIRPHGDVGRVVEEGCCRKHRTSGNEGIIGGKLTLSNPVANDLGDLLDEVIDVRPDYIPCRVCKLLVRRE